MKIVFLQDDFPPESFGGAGISTFELALSMQQAGHEVWVITACQKKEEVGVSEYEGLKIFKIYSNYHERWRAYLSLYNPKTLTPLKLFLEEMKPDIVHVNNIHFHLSYHSLKLVKRYAKAVVFTARDVMAFNYGGLKTKRYIQEGDYRVSWRDHIRQAGKRWNPLRNIFIRHYLRYADAIFAVSDALQVALSVNGISGVKVLHTGIDMSRWVKDEERAAAFIQQYRLENKKIIFFGGRLSEAKGGDKVIEALAKVVLKIPEAVLVVAGKEDAYAQRMKQKANMLGMKDNIIFTGWIDGEALKAAYVASDVVCVPTLFFDSLPRTVLEGMAMEKPVIATFLGGAKEAIKDGMTGYVVNPFDIEAMAEKIEELLHDKEKAERFGRAGREKIKSEFNLSEKTKQLIGIYEGLCALKHL